MPLAASPTTASKPSRLLALVCAAVVAAYDRRWLAQPVSALRDPGDPAPPVLSRLKARVLAGLEALVARAHRRGRPPADRETADLRAQLAWVQAELDVAASVITARGVRDRRLQDRLVAAAERLRHEHGVSWRDFARSLGIPERTFRSWRRRPPAPPAPPSPDPPPAPPAPRPPRNAGRFALELCPPDLQAVADTSHLRAFGVDLRLVAAQDLGRRHQQSLSAFAIENHENAEVVVRVLTEALGSLAGAQLLVDQGTPYMAQATRQACDHFDVDHEPQKEAAPTEKATIERAFGVVKQALRPVLDLTDRLAAALPALARVEFAKAAATLLLSCYLRVYRAGRRHLPHPLQGADPAALRDTVAAARDAARAENRSRKLFLVQLHADYHLEEFISCDAFVRAHRRHALEDLQAADRIVRDRACRCRIRRCDRYFAGVLRRVAEQGCARRAAQATAAKAQRERDREHARLMAREQYWSAHPGLRFVHALDGLLAQWDPTAGTLLFDGEGWALGSLRRALSDFQRRAPLVWTYDVDAAWQAWVATIAASHDALAAIFARFDAERTRFAAAATPFSSASDSATLRGQDRRQHERSPPPSA